MISVAAWRAALLVCTYVHTVIEHATKRDNILCRASSPHYDQLVDLTRAHGEQGCGGVNVKASWNNSAVCDFGVFDV
jgi:hypothetical protein